MKCLKLLSSFCREEDALFLSYCFCSDLSLYVLARKTVDPSGLKARFDTLAVVVTLVLFTNFRKSD